MSDELYDDRQRWPVGSEPELLAFHDRSADEAYRYAARLTRGNRAAAEDLVQDAFVKLVRSARDGSVTEVGIGWLITVIRHRFVDVLRSAEREKRRMQLVVVNAATTYTTPSGPSAILDGLDARQRAALLFRYVDDLPVAEVAELLDISVRATESLLQRAKRNVRTMEEAS